jgi:hypothetical protein
MYNFIHQGIEFGIVGNAVGASFAVLVAEEMFASGCELLISMTQGILGVEMDGARRSDRSGKVLILISTAAFPASYS